QAAGREVVYRLVETSGPEHEKVFTVEVTVDGVVAGRGTG
ncbi:MAG TPA: ribonuclease III, partial [Clostridiales bacterium]|nr:ribonuclease III [Clostridiales bacterium]